MVGEVTMRASTFAAAALLVALLGCARMHPTYLVTTLAPPFVGNSQKDLRHVWSFRGSESVEVAAFYAAQRSAAEGWHDKPDSYQIVRAPLRARDSGRILASIGGEAPVRGPLVCSGVQRPSFARIVGAALHPIDPPEPDGLLALVADQGIIVVAKRDDTAGRFTRLYVYTEASSTWSQAPLPAAERVWTNGSVHLVVRGNDVSRIDGRGWSKSFVAQPRFVLDSAMRRAQVVLVQSGEASVVLDAETGDEVARADGGGFISAIDNVFLLVAWKAGKTGRIVSRERGEIWSGPIGPAVRLLRGGDDPVLGMSGCVVFADSGRRVPVAGTPYLIVGDEVISADESAVHITSVADGGAGCHADF